MANLGGIFSTLMALNIERQCLDQRGLSNGATTTLFLDFCGHIGFYVTPTLGSNYFQDRNTRDRKQASKRKNFHFLISPFTTINTQNTLIFSR